MGHPKALWFGKNVKMSDGGRVRLKHRELFLDSSTANAAADVVQKARAAVRDTIAQLRNPTDQNLKALARAFFYTDSPGDLATIMATLELVNGGICGNVNFKTDNSSKARMTSITKGLVPDISLIEGYVFNHAKRKGDIHVSRDYILNDKYQAVRTFIHEASHRFANTTDETYFWPPTNNSGNWEYSDAANLVRDKLLHNADSYAYFVMFTGYK